MCKEYFRSQQPPANETICFNFGEPRRRSGKNQQARGARARSLAGLGVEAAKQAAFDQSPRTSSPLNSPAPRVTGSRCRAPPLQLGATDSSTPLSCKCRRELGCWALPVPGLWTWGAEGSVLPPAQTLPGGNTRRGSQNRCVSPLAPRSALARLVIGVAAPPCPRSSPTSPRSAVRELTPLLSGLCRPGEIRKADARSAFPRRSFCFFPFAERTGETERGGGQAKAGPLSTLFAPSLTRCFLTACPYLSIFPFSTHCLSQAESGAEPRGKTWLLSIVGGQAPVFSLSRGREEEQAGEPRTTQARQGCAPSRWPRPYAPSRSDGHPAPGPGPGPRLELTLGPQESDLVLMGSESSSSAFQHPEPPLPRGSCAPSLPRVTRVSTLAGTLGARDEPGIPSNGFTTVGGLARGGHTEALRPSLLCPERKGFLLQSTKAKRPGRALKSPELGGGRGV